MERKYFYLYLYWQFILAIYMANTKHFIRIFMKNTRVFGVFGVIGLTGFWFCMAHLYRLIPIIIVFFTFFFNQK